MEFDQLFLYVSNRVLSRRRRKLRGQDGMHFDRIRLYFQRRDMEQFFVRLFVSDELHFERNQVRGKMHCR